MNLPTQDKMTETEALAWAQARKKDTETVMVAQCPCCSNWLAIYVDQSARREIVPDTTPATPTLANATDDIVRNW